MVTMLFVFLLILLYTTTPIASQRVRRATFEEFLVCDERDVQVYMSRNIGENHWDGRVEINNWPDFSRLTLTLILDASASVEARNDKTLVRASNNNKTFVISVNNRSENSNKVFFNVQFDPRMLPNVERLKIFKFDVCDDPIQVTYTCGDTSSAGPC